MSMDVLQRIYYGVYVHVRWGVEWFRFSSTGTITEMKLSPTGSTLCIYWSCLYYPVVGSIHTYSTLHHHLHHHPIHRLPGFPKAGYINQYITTHARRFPASWRNSCLRNLNRNWCNKWWYSGQGEIDWEVCSASGNQSSDVAYCWEIIGDLGATWSKRKLLVPQ